MRKALISLSFTGILAVIFIASCQKNYNPSQTVNVTQSLNTLFAGLRSTPQTLSVTAGRDTTIFGSKGTMLHFYTYSFKDANNNILTSGTVSLQLIEMYKPGDMVANRATTMVNGQILQSGGQITIKAMMNGQTVYANAYGIGFMQGAPSYSPMALYYGATSNADSIATWTISDTAHGGATANNTTNDSIPSGNANFYVFDTCINFGWANCDWFGSNDSPKTTISAILPDTSFNPGNTQMFLVLPSINAVLSNSEDWRGNSMYTAATNTFELTSEGSTNIVPAGLSYELVLITNKNGQYYYYQQSGTIPHNGLVAIAALAPDAQGDVISRLQGL